MLSASHLIKFVLIVGSNGKRISELPYETVSLIYFGVYWRKIFSRLMMTPTGIQRQHICDPFLLHELGRL